MDHAEMRSYLRDQIDRRRHLFSERIIDNANSFAFPDFLVKGQPNKKHRQSKVRKYAGDVRIARGDIIGREANTQSGLSCCPLRKAVGSNKQPRVFTEN